MEMKQKLPITNDTVKAVLTGKFITLQTCLKKQGKSQINN